MKNAPETVYVVDDDPAVVKALTRLLAAAGLHVVAYASAEDFLERHDPDRPGCAIIDLDLPGADGFAVQERLASEQADRAIIFLTGRGDIPASVRAMKAGAVDFLTKPVEASALLAAVGEAFERDSNTRETTQQRRMTEQRWLSLTPREREVFDCVVAGRLNKQIAADLGTVEKTVKVHRGRMMQKMGVRTVADLVRLGARLRP